MKPLTEQPFEDFAWSWHELFLSEVFLFFLTLNKKSSVSKTYDTCHIQMFSNLTEISNNNTSHKSRANKLDILSCLTNNPANLLPYLTKYY